MMGKASARAHAKPPDGSHLDPVHVVRGAGQAAALLNPDRVRLLAALAAPASATGVAAQVGMTRQRVNYHLRQLEKAGLVELVEERRKGNCTERVVRASARSYLISPEVLGALGSGGSAGAARDRFSAAYLVTSVARVLHDLAVLRARADRAGQSLATLAVETDVRFGSAADRAAFTEELTGVLARLAAKYHVEGSGRVFRFLVGGYPAITKPQDDSDAP